MVGCAKPSQDEPMTDAKSTESAKLNPPPEPEEAPRAYFPPIAASVKPIRIGLLEDRTGTFGLFGNPKHHGTLLAIKEINDGYTLRSGPTGIGVAPAGQGNADVGPILIPSNDKGVLGRELRLVAPDPQSSLERYEALTHELITQYRVDVLIGGFASSEREVIRPIINKAQQLYFYTNQYEGGVAEKYGFFTGAVAEQQIVPIMQYMTSEFGGRIYTPAADYNFGQLSAMWTRALAPVMDAEVIGEEFIPLEVTDFSEVQSRIKQADPDWLMMYTTGENHSGYYPQANAAGLRKPMGSSINMAQGYEHRRYPAPALAGMHVAVNYMEEIPTLRNQNFVQRWREMFPDEPYISQQAQNAYVTVHLYASAVRLAGTTRQEEVIKVLESGIGIEAPEGYVFMDPATHHLSHHIRIARAEEDHTITFVQEWPGIEAWWLRHMGVNLVRHPESKQYTMEDDPYYSVILLMQETRAKAIKAGLLYRFLQFVDWPEEAWKHESVVIGILGDAPFTGAFDEIKNNAVKGKPIRIRALSGPEDVEAMRECHIVFIASSESFRIEAILEELQGTSVLTVGEMDGFLDAGGMINFVRKEGKVRFEVNEPSMTKSFLRINSNILDLAINVR